MDIEIKLKLKIKNVEMELTTKDAEELCDVLAKLLGRQQQIVTTYPIYIEPWHPRPYYEWPGTVYCNSDSTIKLEALYG